MSRDLRASYLLSLVIIWMVSIRALEFSDSAKSNKIFGRCSLHQEHEFKSLAGYFEQNGIYMSHVTIRLTKEPQQWDNCTVGFQYENEDTIELSLTDEAILNKWILSSYYEDFYYIEYKSNTTYAKPGKYKLYFGNNTVKTFYNVPSSKTASSDLKVYNPDIINVKIIDKEFSVCIAYLLSQNYTASDYLECSGDNHEKGLKKKTKIECNVTAFAFHSAKSITQINISVPYPNSYVTDYLLKCMPNGRGANQAVSYCFKVVENSFHQLLKNNMPIIVTVILFIFFISMISVMYIHFKQKVHNEKFGYVKRLPHLTKLANWPLERQMTQQLNLDDSSSTVGSPHHMEWDPELWPEWVPNANLMRFPRNDIDFDERHPLGIGHYGFVFNGVVKYGFAR